MVNVVIQVAKLREESERLTTPNLLRRLGHEQFWPSLASSISSARFPVKPVLCLANFAQPRFGPTSG
jgi:hypothetical protein